MEIWWVNHSFLQYLDKSPWWHIDFIRFSTSLWGILGQDFVEVYIPGWEHPNSIPPAETDQNVQWHSGKVGEGSCKPWGDHGCVGWSSGLNQPGFGNYMPPPEVEEVPTGTPAAAVVEGVDQVGSKHQNYDGFDRDRWWDDGNPRWWDESRISSSLVEKVHGPLKRYSIGDSGRRSIAWWCRIFRWVRQVESIK